MSEVAETAVAEPTTTEAAPEAAEVETPANDVVANDVADPNAPAPDAEEPKQDEPKKDAEEKERETALFKRSLKFREEANAKLAKAEQTLADVRREKESFAKERAELQKVRELHDRCKSDPWAFIEAFNIDTADFARKMIELNEPHARELAKIKQENDEFRKKYEEEKQQREQQAISARVQEAKVKFVQYVHDYADKYPDIADEDPGEVADMFWEVARATHQAHGVYPTVDQVAAHLQRLADQKRATRESRRTQRTGAKPATAPSEPGGGKTDPQRTAPTGQPANGPGLRSTTPKTLTNGSATHVATAPKENATDEEIDAWARAELRRLRTSLTE